MATNIFEPTLLLVKRWLLEANLVIQMDNFFNEGSSQGPLPVADPKIILYEQTMVEITAKK